MTVHVSEHSLCAALRCVDGDGGVDVYVCGDVYVHVYVCVPWGGSPTLSLRNSIFPRGWAEQEPRVCVSS